jgi:glycosyltransferase involved in cell wall biosynthesis
MPYFSIIVPTYNSEKTLAVCMNSVMNQSFTDFEVLIIDAVSKDKTLEIAHGFNDSRIQITSEPDVGIYDAMNKGIRLAKGKWLYFLGSDDFLYDTTVLEIVYKKNREESLDIVYGNVNAIDCIYDGPFDFSKIQSKNICHQSIFYSKKLLIELGGYDLKYKVCSDYDLNLKWFFNKKYKAAYIDKIIANYTSNGFSCDNYDRKFYDDLPKKILRLGIGKLNVADLKVHALNASYIKHNRHQYFAWIYFGFLYYIFRVFSIVQRKMLTHGK